MSEFNPGHVTWTPGAVYELITGAYFLDNCTSFHDPDGEFVFLYIPSDHRVALSPLHLNDERYRKSFIKIIAELLRCGVTVLGNLAQTFFADQDTRCIMLGSMKDLGKASPDNFKSIFNTAPYTKVLSQHLRVDDLLRCDDRRAMADRLNDFLGEGNQTPDRIRGIDIHDALETIAVPEDQTKNKKKRPRSREEVLEEVLKKMRAQGIIIEGISLEIIRLRRLTEKGTSYFTVDPITREIGAPCESDDFPWDPKIEEWAAEGRRGGATFTRDEIISKKTASGKSVFAKIPTL